MKSDILEYFKSAKLPIIEKCYEVNLSMISEGFLYSEITGSGKTRNQAKSNIWKKIQSEYLDLELLYSNEEISYINVPINRAPTGDLVLYEGQELRRWKVEELIKESENNSKYDNIIEDDTISHCYIMKRGLYYEENYNGYTEFKLYAGVYPKKDAIRHAKGCNELTIVPINTEEHNKYHSKHINGIIKRIIGLESSEDEIIRKYNEIKNHYEEKVAH